MKKLLLIVVLFSFLLSANSFAQTKWFKGSLNDAITRARVLERNLVVKIGTSWCSTCILIDNEVFKQKIGSKLSDEFFCLQYDAEEGEGVELAKEFNIISYPTILILDKNGEEIDRILDYKDPSSFVSQVFDYSQGKKVIATHEKYLGKNPKDVKMLYEVGEKFAFKGDEEKANKYLGKVIEIDPSNKKGYSDKALYALGKYLYLHSKKNYAKALPLFNELENNYPDSSYAKKTDLARAKAYLEMKNKKQAYASLQNYLLKNKGDTSAKTHNAYAWFCYRNKFHLKDGLEIARKGVELNPKYDGLWDTMAEIYSAMGEDDKALNAIRKAVELKPKDIYYNIQLDKFKDKREKPLKQNKG